MERGRTARHQPHRIAGRVSVDAKEGMPHHTAALTRCPDPRATEKSSRKPPVQFQKTVRTGNLCPLVDCPPATLGPGATGLRDPCGRDHPRDKGSLTRFAWSGQSHSNSSVVGRQEKDRLPPITQAKIVGAFDASNNLTALEQGIYRGLSHYPFSCDNVFPPRPQYHRAAKRATLLPAFSRSRRLATAFCRRTR